MGFKEDEKKSTSQSGTKRISAKQRRENEEREKMQRRRNQSWSVVLFALGIFTLFLTLVEGSAGWSKLFYGFRGIFGVGVFFVPIILFYIALLKAKQINETTVFAKIIEVSLMFLLVTAAVQIIAVGTVLPEGKQGFAQSIKFLFIEGKKLNGGGIVGGILSSILLNLGKVGATIVVLLLIFILVMFILDLSLPELFALVTKPFKSAASAVVDDRNEMHRQKEENRAKVSDKENTADAQRAKNAEDSRKNAKKAKSDIDIDIEPKPVGTPHIPMISPIDEINMGNKKNVKEKKFEFDIPISGQTVSSKSSTEVQVQNENAQSAPQTPGLKKLFPDLSDMSNTNIANSINAESVKTESVVSDVQLEKKSDNSELDALIEKNTKKIEEKKDENLKEHQHTLPPISLLKNYDNSKNDRQARTEMQQNSELLVKTLSDFKVEAKVVDIHRGPSVTRYELQPAMGVKISKITSLSDDIMMKLKAEGVRIEAPIPGKDAVGIEVPNKVKDTVSFRSMIESYEFGQMRKNTKLAIAIGKDIDGNIIVGDIAKMPHMIVAGTTGSGKSVCTCSMIMSILYNATPDEVKLILIDPKLVEFPRFNGIPHLLMPVITDPNKAAGALNWSVQMMLSRYQKFNEAGVSDIASYNTLAKDSPDFEYMPNVVIFIDEFADLMMAAKNDVEKAVCRIAQMARAAGMHLIIATQRPTVDVVTGLVKANIPSRIALKTFAKIDSVTVLDMAGAESMLGNGDMLYFPIGLKKPKRVQGCFCSPEEVKNVVEFLTKDGKATYDENITAEIESMIPVEKGADKSGSSSGDDIDYSDDNAVLERAIEVVVEMGQASTTSLQKKLKLGYARASRIMDELEEIGVVGPYEGAKPRRVLMTHQQLAERRLRNQD
ncbi:MAG: DNA translocase FtsK [Oscillospiraceae bacterium]|nr:DNA translocase FtsK [Oscillospiraceae bacterium]